MNTSVRFDAVANRDYSVYSGKPDTATLLGFVRYDSAGRFFARTRGSPDSAADTRTFTTREGATAWLETAVAGVIPRNRRLP
jgi:hypothetical protein